MIIRKLCAVGKPCHITLAALSICLALGCFSGITPAFSQENESDEARDSETDSFVPQEVEVPSPISSEKAQITYPRAVALMGDKLLVVDLDLPGIWIKDQDKLSVYTPGTKLLRKPMQRPWCVVPHPEKGILIGDSATREIYHASQPGPNLVALNGGYLGIPQAIAVDAAGEFIYVGDVEKRSVFRLPIQGGQPQLVARVDARALSFDSDGALWAVTPGADAVQKINVETNEAEVVVTDRPFQMPNGIVWSGDEGFVTDVYGKSIWRFTADGETEKWFEGEPLAGPVGIAADETHLFVADPQSKQVYKFDRKSKSVQPAI